MGALNLRSRGAGTIRRVVRRGQLFICGLCRSHHHNPYAAEDCLDGCWDHLLSLDPVIVRQRGESTAYRCRFCARDHAKRSEAGSCAADCLERMNRIHELEHALDLDDGEPVRKRPARRSAAARALRIVRPPPPRPRGSAAASPETPPAPPSPDDTPAAAAPEPAEAPAPASVASETTPAAAAETATAKPKVKPSEVFFRDGAKYACTVCQERYFTRMEVTNCYESHT